MTDEFAEPSAGDFFRPRDHQGELLFFKPHSIEKDVQTENGPSDATKSDVVILDGPEAGTEYANTLVFGALQHSLSKQVGTGKWVLGRLGQGQKKPGKNPPWTLAAPTDADKDVARRYLAANTAAPF